MDEPPYISNVLREEFYKMGARLVTRKLIMFSQSKDPGQKKSEQKGLKLYATTSDGKVWYSYEGTPEDKG